MLERHRRPAHHLGSDGICYRMPERHMALQPHVRLISGRAIGGMRRAWRRQTVRFDHRRRLEQDAANNTTEGTCAGWLYSGKHSQGSSIHVRTDVSGTNSGIDSSGAIERKWITGPIRSKCTLDKVRRTVFGTSQIDQIPLREQRTFGKGRGFLGLTRSRG
jgi:hypothetical protein